jgi:hypothetical protein
MTAKNPRSLWPVLPAVLVLAGIPAIAGGAGQLVGFITDEMGRAIPEARLTVTGPGASGVQFVETDTEGRFRIIVMETVRPVSIRAEADGKVPVVYREFRVRPDRVTHLDLRLRSRGAHDVLVLVDGRVPYHYLALEGARSTLPGTVHVMDLRECSSSAGRDLMRALETRPSAILAIGEEAAQIARSHVRDIPVVHTMVPDPHPDVMASKNLCGLSLVGGFEQQLVRLRTLDPGIRRIGTIYDPSRLTSAVARLRRATAEAGMELVAGCVHQSEDLPHALNYTAANFADVRRFIEDRGMILVVPDPSLAGSRQSFSFRPGFWESGAAAGRLVRQIVSGRLTPAEVGILRPVDGEMGGDEAGASPVMRWRPDPGEKLPLIGAVTLAASLKLPSSRGLEPEEK